MPGMNEYKCRVCGIDMVDLGHTYTPDEKHPDKLRTHVCTPCEFVSVSVSAGSVESNITTLTAAAERAFIDLFHSDS